MLQQLKTFFGIETVPVRPKYDGNTWDLRKWVVLTVKQILSSFMKAHLVGVM